MNFIKLGAGAAIVMAIAVGIMSVYENDITLAIWEFNTAGWALVAYCLAEND